MRWWVALSFAYLAAPSVQVQPADEIPVDQELAAYCLGVNRQVVVEFRRIAKWQCGAGADHEWCREARDNAPGHISTAQNMERRLTKYLVDKGAMVEGRIEGLRKGLAQSVVNGAIDVALCNAKSDQQPKARECKELEQCEGLSELSFPLAPKRP